MCGEGELRFTGGRISTGSGVCDFRPDPSTIIPFSSLNRSIHAVLRTSQKSGMDDTFENARALSRMESSVNDRPFVCFHCNQIATSCVVDGIIRRNIIPESLPIPPKLVLYSRVDPWHVCLVAGFRDFA